MADRLMVIAPHPDDESLGAGALMARASSRGDEVYVVFLTVGDGFVEDAARYYLSLDVTPEEYLHMGYERNTEATRAMAEVGVPADHIFFLGFPDGGLDTLWRTHWDGETWTSRTTGQSQVPYLNAWRPSLPYRGSVLFDLLVEILNTVRPNRLVIPSAFDTHPDHWATNAFATLAWADLARRHVTFGKVDRWGYLVHWPTWPFPLVYRPDDRFELPRPLIDLHQEPWRDEAMTPDFVERKRLALMAHESQAELIKPFMLAFCRSSEMFFQEDQFEAIPDRGGLLVANPRGTWRRRVVRNSAPLIGARFGRGQDVDFAEVMVKDVALPHDAVLEISLHVLDDPVRHYQWTTGALAPGAAVTRGRGVMTLSWPQGWIGTSRLVVVGVQLWSSGKCEGKIPFRPLKWPMAGSG